MTNKELDSYLASVERHLRDVRRPARQSILAEMRAHLEEAIDRRRAEVPGLSLEEATQAAVKEFGEPAEIAASRRPAPREKMPARRRRLIAAAVILALVLGGLALAVIDASSLDRSSRFARPYARDSWFEHHNGTINDTFEVVGDAKQVNIYLSIRPDSDGGCAGVRLTDPRGEVVLNEPETCGSIHRDLVYHTTGLWRVDYTFRDFSGHVDARVFLR